MVECWKNSLLLFHRFPSWRGLWPLQDDGAGCYGVMSSVLWRTLFEHSVEETLRTWIAVVFNNLCTDSSTPSHIMFASLELSKEVNYFVYLSLVALSFDARQHYHKTFDVALKWGHIMAESPLLTRVLSHPHVAHSSYCHNYPSTHSSPPLTPLPPPPKKSKKCKWGRC